MKAKFRSFDKPVFPINHLTDSDAIATVNWQLCLITSINIFNTMQSVKNVSVCRIIRHAMRVGLNFQVARFFSINY